MNVFFCRLDEKQQLLFLNLILAEGENWDDANFDRIFQQSFRRLYNTDLENVPAFST